MLDKERIIIIRTLKLIIYFLNLGILTLSFAMDWKIIGIITIFFNIITFGLIEDRTWEDRN